MEGATSAAWATIRRPVIAAIRSAMHGVEDVLDFLADLIHKLAHDVWGAINFMSPLVQAMWSWIMHAAGTVEIWATSVARWWWENVAAPAINDLRGFADWAWSQAQALYHDVQGALTWWIANVIAPAWHWIESAANVVGGWIAAALSAFYHDVILPGWQLLQDTAKMLATLWHWWEKVAADAVALVVKAQQWLVWMAEHTFDDLVHMGKELAQGQGLTATVHYLRDSYDEAASLLDDLASWLS